MASSLDLIKKLQIKAGTRLWLINVPLEFAEAITAGGEVEPVKPGEPYDGVIAFAENPTEVDSFARQAVPKLPEDGLLWFAYRKGAKAAGLNRDNGWQTLEEFGLTTVRSISFDDTWTGLRFRAVDKVKPR